MLVDLHVHTFSSGDAMAAPEDVIDRALAIGLDGVCVVEHDSYDASTTAAELGEGSGLVVLRGVEVATDAGHVLVYGVTDDGWREVAVGGSVPAQALVEYVRDAGGVAIPAHPYRLDPTSMGDALASIAGLFAVEGFNGSAMRAENAAACEFAARYGLRVTGGSDAHMPGHVGRCVTSFDRRVETEAELAAELKAGRFAGRYLLGPIEI
jgi:predicted metal-dependent phosphoesterase TrpH